MTSGQNKTGRLAVPEPNHGGRCYLSFYRIKTKNPQSGVGAANHLLEISFVADSATPTEPLGFLSCSRGFISGYSDKALLPFSDAPSCTEIFFT